MKNVLVIAMLVGCGGDPTSYDELDAGSTVPPFVSTVPTTDVTPDAASPTTDAAGSDSSTDTVVSCSETCEPQFGYCEGETCTPWPPLPPPSTWWCYDPSGTGIGCCVSICQSECDANLPEDLWTACSNGCELRCKELFAELGW